LDALRIERDEVLRVLVAAEFLVGGLHQHKGQWRRHANER
jgi:hypothetical protein